ncbi:MAG: antibiotic ABC transporter ATP-binding protein [Crocinitomicaceae bacterium]|nr:antibiotic ABC transporter ATP-binding protein [Crocinitomicaceae bacterium]|tara:strand:- start:157 stop:1923 length:1767 start_codon:yes stop_codon:yes gene_type:complete
MTKEGVTGKVFDAATLKRIIRQAQPYRMRFAATGALVLLLSGMVWIRPALIRMAVDDAIPKGDSVYLLQIFCAVIALLVFEALLQFRVTYMANWVAQSVSLDLRSKLFEHVAKFRLRYFDKTPVGTLVTRHVSDIDGIANVFSNGILNAIGDILSLVVVIGTMFWVDWKLTFLVLAPIPVLLLATRVFQKVIKKAFIDVRNEVSRMNEFVQEHVTGMHIIQAFGREKREAAEFSKINSSHRDANIRSIWAFSVFFPLVELLSATSVAILLWWGMQDVLVERMTLGILLQFILYVFMLYRPIRQLADRFNVLQMGIVNSDRVFKLLAKDEGMEDPEGDEWHTFKGTIEFEHVWFAYENEQWVLEDVSFQIEAGQKVAFVGATGAGKSTIINLLTRFYAHQKGTIRIDGVDISTIPIRALRNEVGVVLQDVFLFSDDLINNVTMYKEGFTQTDLDDAAEAVGADEFIARLPEGWKQNVRERGAILSVGQRQLIAFMRAYLASPKILVLDEATSSIDSESELLIQRATERITRGRTSLIVAHRLSTIRDADAIFVLEKGRIVQSGSHESLIEESGVYRELNRMQMGTSSTE